MAKNGIDAWVRVVDVLADVGTEDEVDVTPFEGISFTSVIP